MKLDECYSTNFLNVKDRISKKSGVRGTLCRALEDWLNENSVGRNSATGYGVKRIYNYHQCELEQRFVANIRRFPEEEPSFSQAGQSRNKSSQMEFTNYIVL